MSKNWAGVISASNLSEAQSSTRHIAGPAVVKRSAQATEWKQHREILLRRIVFSTNIQGKKAPIHRQPLCPRRPLPYWAWQWRRVARWKVIMRKKLHNCARNHPCQRPHNEEQGLLKWAWHAPWILISSPLDFISSNSIVLLKPLSSRPQYGNDERPSRLAMWFLQVRLLPRQRGKGGVSERSDTHTNIVHNHAAPG